MSGKELSAVETSRKLKVGLPRIYQLIWSGKLPARKLDGRWLVSEQAVRARLEERAD
jgi:excisionase family DNA binding protein